MKKTKIALVQMESIVGDVKSNLGKIEYYIKESYRNKVDIICFPEAVITPFASPVKTSNRKEIWLKYLAARAYDNSIFIASCNLIGSNGKGTTFGGGILALDPKGNLIEEDFNEEENIRYIELDPSLINNIKDKNNKSMKFRHYLANRRPELYSKIIE